MGQVDPERIKAALEHAEDMAEPIKSRRPPASVEKGVEALAGRIPFNGAPLYKTPLNGAPLYKTPLHGAPLYKTSFFARG